MSLEDELKEVLETAVTQFEVDWGSGMVVNVRAEFFVTNANGTEFLEWIKGMFEAVYRNNRTG